MQRFFQLSRKVLLGFIAVMLFTNVTFAFSINVHICQGEFQSMSFFGTKSSCNKMIPTPEELGSCCDKKKQDNQLTISQRSCCDNKQFSAASVLEKFSQDQFAAEINHLVPSHLVEAHSVIFQHEPAHDWEAGNLPPPPIIKPKKRQAVLQVFQI